MTSNDSAAALVAAMPFAQALGLQVTDAGPELVVGRMDWAPERTTGGDILHGGALMAMADSLGAICAFLNLPPGVGTSTIESKTNFFRAVTAGVVVGQARPLHVGRRTIVVQTEVRDGDDRLVSLSTQTQAVLAG